MFKRGQAQSPPSFSTPRTCSTMYVPPATTSWSVKATSKRTTMVKSICQGAGIAPAPRTPNIKDDKSSEGRFGCQGQHHGTRRSSAARPSGSCALRTSTAPSPRWPRNLAPPPRRCAIGSSRTRWVPADAKADHGKREESRWLRREAELLRHRRRGSQGKRRSKKLAIEAPARRLTDSDREAACEADRGRGGTAETKRGRDTAESEPTADGSHPPVASGLPFCPRASCPVAGSWLALLASARADEISLAT